MERLRAQQLLVALRAADGPRRGHFVRVARRLRQRRAAVFS